MTACPRCKFDPDAEVLASWSFHVPRDLQSMNRHVVNDRGGWRYRKERDGWHSDFHAMRVVHRIPPATSVSRRRVTIVRVYNGRQQEMDHANLVGGAKACVDALKLAGLIFDDKAQWLEDHYQQERGAERGTRVVIEEVASC